MEKTKAKSQELFSAPDLVCSETTPTAHKINHLTNRKLHLEGKLSRTYLVDNNKLLLDSLADLSMEQKPNLKHPYRGLLFRHLVSMLVFLRRKTKPGQLRRILSFKVILCSLLKIKSQLTQLNFRLVQQLKAIPLIFLP